MTFDEAKQRIDQLQGDAGYATHGDVDRPIYSGMEMHNVLNELDNSLDDLRDEYAPTVEMTMDQYTILAEHRNNAVKRLDKVGILEFMSAYSELMSDFNHLTLMHAWLHPELIKVVK